MNDPFQWLAQHYPLIIRTAHHAQIAVQDGYHNFWIGKEGFKAQLFGNQRVYFPNRERLLKELASFDYRATDLAKLRALEGLVRKARGKLGIFCDAGWKAGKGRIAVINMMSDEWQCTVRDIECVSSNDAEIEATTLAKRLYDRGTIYTDLQGLEDGDRIVWIGRKENKEADQFSNLRGHAT